MINGTFSKVEGFKCFKVYEVIRGEDKAIIGYYTTFEKAKKGLKNFINSIKREFNTTIIESEIGNESWAFTQLDKDLF